MVGERMGRRGEVLMVLASLFCRAWCEGGKHFFSLFFSVFFSSCFWVFMFLFHSFGQIE